MKFPKPFLAMVVVSSCLASQAWADEDAAGVPDDATAVASDATATADDATGDPAPLAPDATAADAAAADGTASSDAASAADAVDGGHGEHDGDKHNDGCSASPRASDPLALGLVAAAAAWLLSRSRQSARVRSEGR